MLVSYCLALRAIYVDTLWIGFMSSKYFRARYMYNEDIIVISSISSSIIRNVLIWGFLILRKGVSNSNGIDSRVTFKIWTNIAKTRKHLREGMKWNISDVNLA